MSSGHTGAGTPDEGDDPFAYLYRPADGEAPRQQGPRQPSYHQVRPVGERTYGGQQGYGGTPGPRQPQASPDARYAAPETQGGGHRQGPPDRRRPPSGDSRRNGLLVGAIAVVLAVVLGVAAAIAFSGDDEDPSADGDPTPTQGSSGDAQGGDEPSGEPTDDESEEPGEPPVAAVGDLQAGGGATVEDTVTGARSDDGSYVAVRNAQGATVTWTFDIEGEPLEQYFFYIGYSAVSDGQTMSFSVNGEPREDPIEFKDYNPNSDDWETSWVKTYKNVNLTEGENTIQLTCSGSCDILIDQMRLTEEQEGR